MATAPGLALDLARRLSAKSARGLIADWVKSMMNRRRIQQRLRKAE
jgi:hypothetical protein